MGMRHDEEGMETGEEGVSMLPACSCLGWWCYMPHLGKLFSLHSYRRYVWRCAICWRTVQKSEALNTSRYGALLSMFGPHAPNIDDRMIGTALLSTSRYLLSNGLLDVLMIPAGASTETACLTRSIGTFSCSAIWACVSHSVSAIFS